MSPATLPRQRRYCCADTNCLRAWLHSGPHLPGCRVCESTDHMTDQCPHPKEAAMGTRPKLNPFPYIPVSCRNGHCTHETCFRYRSYRCPSGECRHADEGLACGEALPTKPPAPTGTTPTTD